MVDIVEYELAATIITKMILLFVIGFSVLYYL